MTEQHKFRYLLSWCWGAVLHASCFRAWAQRVSLQQAVYLLGRGASIHNRSASSYCCLNKWRRNPESAIINSFVDGRTETWWSCRTCQRPHVKPVVRWCPRDGDPHSVCITPILDHVSSCLQEKRLTKGMSSHTPHYSLFTGQTMTLLHQSLQ